MNTSAPVLCPNFYVFSFFNLFTVVIQDLSVSIVCSASLSMKSLILEDGCFHRFSVSLTVSFRKLTVEVEGQPSWVLGFLHLVECRAHGDMAEVNDTAHLILLHCILPIIALEDVS